MIVTHVQRYLPQRPPILMLDRVIDIEPGKRGTGVKQFRPSDSYFEGHFPGQPVLPGIFLIEAFAQTAMIVLSVRGEADAPEEPELGFLAKVNEAAFYQVVGPEDLIHFEVTYTKRIRQFLSVSCLARRGEQRVARADLTLAMPESVQPLPEGRISVGEQDEPLG